MYTSYSIALVRAVITKYIFFCSGIGHDAPFRWPNAPMVRGQWLRPTPVG